MFKNNKSNDLFKTARFPWINLYNNYYTTKKTENVVRKKI